MTNPLRIGLIGDHDPAVVAHQAIPRALQLAGESIGQPVEWEWLHTGSLDPARISERLAGFDGLWLVPASPYAGTEAVLAAARYVRETGRPFLGTCGGFQHALLEYARNVWRLEEAAHAELDPEAPDPIIAPLACSLVEVKGDVFFPPGSRIADLYGDTHAIEGYHCRYGLSPSCAGRLSDGPLRIVARDSAGEVRALELWGHPFYILTLFQPERAAREGRVPPLVRGLLEATRRISTADAWSLIPGP